MRYGMPSGLLKQSFVCGFVYVFRTGATFLRTNYVELEWNRVFSHEGFQFCLSFYANDSGDEFSLVLIRTIMYVELL